MPKKTTHHTTPKEKELGKSPSWVGEMYRGIAGLIEALRKEMHARFDRMEKMFDRLEKLVLAGYSDRKRRVERLERKGEVDRSR